MTNLAIVSIVIGILAIVLRSPLIFAPDATTDFFKKLIANTTRIRIMGLCLAVLAPTLIVTAWGSDQIAAKVLLVLGCVWALAVVFLLIFPSAYKLVAEFFIDMDSSILRGIGVLGVIVGAIFIYLGFAVF